MRKLFTLTRAQRRQRWLLASFGLGAAAVILPGLAISAMSPPQRSAPKPIVQAQETLALTRTAAHADCSDFDNQWEAQAFLQTQKAADRHLLDEDRDGIACERLP